jgi:hypothetical protein
MMCWHSCGECRPRLSREKSTDGHLIAIIRQSETTMPEADRKAPDSMLTKFSRRPVFSSKDRTSSTGARKIASRASLANYGPYRYAGDRSRILPGPDDWACFARVVFCARSFQPNVQEGAAGVDMGCKSSNPATAMVAAVHAVVHKNLQPADAFDLYKSLESRRAAGPVDN